MDRYHSHTIHCRSCSVALRRIRQIRPLVWGLLWSSAVLIGVGTGMQLTLVGASIAAVAALALRQLASWEQGLTRDGEAPRNRLT